MMDDKKCFIVDEDLPLIVPKRILVFAPHPDDELLSAGGTILKYKQLGTDITIIIATQGSGGYGEEEEREEIVERRKGEVKKLQSLLNCEIISLNYTKLPVEREQVSQITSLLRQKKPQVILTPHIQDTHRIHRNLAYIVKESIYHAATGEVYGGSGKIWQPHGVYYYESPSFKFQHAKNNNFIIVNIEEFWEKKKELFSQVYKSQRQLLSRILTWAENTAKLRGMEINSEYGEAFIPETTYTPLRLLLV
jgi:N-acetylglucosamine malate deacetylase 1